jgi:glycosyltransferase involved in cell wall biosynthesis
MNTKKICIVSPSLKVGGIERALTVLANYFVEKGHEIIFISCLSGDKFYSLHKDIKLVEPSFENTGSIKKVIFYFKLLFFLRREIKLAKPNVVLSFGDWFNPIVLFSLLGLKFPVFISDRTSPDYKFNSITSFGKKWLYPKSNGFIAQTKRAADYKTNQFKGKLNIKIIPNAIKEIEIYDIDRQNWVVCIARLSWEKGPDRLLEAFSLIENKMDWKLVFAGSGPMRKALEESTKKLNLSNDVVFLGEVKDVDRLLAESSIFVLPSHLEGFPNALCEAMAAGLPTICFDSIPYEDIIIDKENGFVVKNNDINEMAIKINFLIENPEIRTNIAEKAKKSVNDLSYKKIGEKYLNFMFAESEKI